jgi:sulfotransferase
VGIMENQKMFFLAGLPRTGNTLLSAILNQNPDIYCTPISNFAGGLHFLDELNLSQNAFRNELVAQRTVTAVNQYVENYYSDVDKKYIVERNKEWISDAALPLIYKYITKEPKIIFTVRNISEILASLVLISKHIFLEQMKEYEHLCHMSYIQDENERVAEFILLYNTAFSRTFDSLKNSLNNKDIFVVEYDNIVNNPKKTMQNIYNFLEIDQYVHDFNNIEKKEFDNDLIAGDVDHMHDVRKTLSKITSAESVFSRQAIERYDTMNIWHQT